MAEPSIVQGLFGTTPEAYQQQQQRQAMQDAVTMAQLDPMQLARANLMAGANRAAGGVAGCVRGLSRPHLAAQGAAHAAAQDRCGTHPGTGVGKTKARIGQQRKIVASSTAMNPIDVKPRRP